MAHVYLDDGGSVQQTSEGIVGRTQQVDLDCELAKNHLTDAKAGLLGLDEAGGQLQHRCRTLAHMLDAELDQFEVGLLICHQQSAL